MKGSLNGRNQMELFPDPHERRLVQARARNTDPETSHLAAKDAEASGSAGNQRAACLRAVRSEPGLTAAEIASRAGFERHVPSRRLPELREDGTVRNGEERVCRVQGTLCLTWYPGEAGA